MFGPIQNVVFDFDGTLVNTMPALIRGLVESVRVGSGKTITAEQLVSSFGPPPHGVLAQWMNEAQLPVAYAHWLEYEKNQTSEDALPFDGCLDLLEVLRSVKMGIGIFTGRDRVGTVRILKQNGWLGKYFTERHLACGDDGFAPKPKPDSLLHLLKTHEWNASATLMVGDHPYDMMAGRAAGTKTAGALWDIPAGTGTERARFRESWKRWDKVPECDLRIASPQGLLEWVEQNRAR